MMGQGKAFSNNGVVWSDTAGPRLDSDLLLTSATKKKKKIRGGLGCGWLWSWADSGRGRFFAGDARS